MSAKSFFSSHITLFRVVAAIVAFALIGVLLCGANELLGNPISYSIAKSRAEKYIAENYADEGYVLERVGYSFKFKDYLAYAAKPNSEDCRFVVYYNMLGEFRGDSSDGILSNTRRRVDMAYRALADSVFESSAYPYPADIAYGELIFEGDEDAEKERGHDFALSDSILVPDKLYNIVELGAQAGRLTVYVHTDDLTAGNAAQILLQINSLTEQGNVPFRVIDLTLESSEREYYSLIDFLRNDIHEDGLVGRVEDNARKTAEYYAELDAKR